MRSSDAKERFSRTVIGSISPSVLRSSGIERHADVCALAAAGLEIDAGLPSIDDLPDTAAQNAEQGQQQFALALPVETAKADDFARPGPRAKYPSSRSVQERFRALPAPAVARDTGCGLRREDMAVFAADHHLDDLVVGLGAGLVGGDIPAVAEHRALVGKFGDLVHAVRDVEERQPFRRSRLSTSKILVDVGGGQRRGRLVENENARLARQRLGDLDHLAARQRQVLDQRQGMDVPGTGARKRLFGNPALGLRGRSCRSASADR